MTVLNGLPGMPVAQTVNYRRILRQGEYTYLASSKTIDSTKARDWNNPDITTVLEAGLLMGKITTGGLYANSILGVSKNAYTSGGTTITVSVASAVEIVRRIGNSGNLNYAGPPTANGTMAVLGPIAFSAVNTTTGAITTSTLAANMVAGGLVLPTDGSQNPITFIPDGYPVNLLNNLGVAVNVPFAKIPIAGVVQFSQILNWPTDTSIEAWIIDNLNGTNVSGIAGVGSGKFVADYVY